MRLSLHPQDKSARCLLCHMAALSETSDSYKIKCFQFINMKDKHPSSSFSVAQRADGCDGPGLRRQWNLMSTMKSPSSLGGMLLFLMCSLSICTSLNSCKSINKGTESK